MALRFTWLILMSTLTFYLAVPAVSAGNTISVTNFEQGLYGWMVMDAGKLEHKTADVTLIKIAASDEAHSGLHSLKVSFAPGEGWADAGLNLSQACSRWADAKIDEISLWIKGDGSSKEVKIGLQQWADDLTTPITFVVPVSLENREWHEVIVPLARLQESNPSHLLRLPSLISLQINGSGALGTAEFFIDDIEVRNARGEGARYAVGPMDEQIAKLPPAKGLPRMGYWKWGGVDLDEQKKDVALGIGFVSGNCSRLQQERLFLAGIATNYCPPRPSAAYLTAGLNLTDADMDQDSQGHRTGEGIQSSVFHPKVADRYCEFIRDSVRSNTNSPCVCSFLLSSPISMYGEVHYSASTAGDYAVFSRPAKENFRGWLKKAYSNDLPALSKAWNQEFKSWDEVVPPNGPKAGTEGIDTRQSWSDFMHWYNWWLDEITRRGLETARSETQKPLAVMIGGPKVGYGQGIALGNIGPVVRMLGKVRPAFFNDTDGETIFSTRYTRAACSQYGVELMMEHVGPPTLTVYHQYNLLLNILSCGADHIHIAQLGQLFDSNHWFSRMWKNQAPVAQRYHTGYRKSDAAIFHSYMTSWYRPDRWNIDAVNLYDSTNTLWTPDKDYPSWGRALGSPDVVDDAMVEDGALRGRKLLVIPNSSVTVTSAKAVKAIKKWVEEGGTLIGFGEGCLAYTVESNRNLKATPGLAGLIPVSEIEKQKAKSELKIERKIGKGQVMLYLKPANPELKDKSGKRFVDEMMPVLSAEADKAGVRRWCRSEGKYDVNLLYCGRDKKSGKHIFTADFTRYVRNNLPDAIFYTDCSFDFTFDPSLKGDAELIGITDSFEKCEGGNADYNPDSHILAISFKLPSKLKLTCGKGRSGLAVAKHSLLLWQGDDLVLTPSGGYGEKQTQEPVKVTSDGSLNPQNVIMPYLIHGNLHRGDFGRGPTFRLSLSKPGSVTVHVNSVPSLGILVMKLDGKEVLRQELPNKNNNQNPFEGEYDQDFTIDVPAGEHDVQVDNLGDDWMSIDRYVFKGLK